MSRLNDLIRQVGMKDEALAADLQREVAALADRRSFGLNFERHVPEVVELPGRPVRRGDKVRVMPPRGEMPKKADEKLWRVASIDRTARSRIARLESLRDEEDETAEADVDDLVVVAEFRDPIYPGLVSTGKVQRGGDKPFHTVINAENYHALQTLLFTHRGKVDCIYIDPPYNTGSEGWIYNDKYVADDDHYKHSKWLAFLERRLLLAKELLKPSGVLIVAIGDEEHHRLRMLMDQIFDPQNFISDVVWQGGRKNDSRFVSNGADYMLVYARNVAALIADDVRWRERRPGQDEILAAARKAWDESGHVPERATKLMKAWIKALPAGHAARDNNRFYEFDSGTGRAFRKDNISWPGGGGPRYDVLHPVTGKPVKVPGSGWRYPNPERMQEMIDAGRVLFGPDETSFVNRKLYLDEAETVAVESVFNKKRTSAESRMRQILGDKRFPNAKDHEVLMRWLRLVAPAKAVILDFFGGSGTTTEAVMRLNEEDGGARRCILVTNNEVAAVDAKKLRKEGHRPGDPEWEAIGVYDYVAKPRIETVVTGIRSDGSTYSDGLEQNVEFFTLTYEAPLRVASHREFKRIAPLLWLRAGSYGRRIDDVRKGWDVSEAYGVLADLDQVDKFLAALDDQLDVTLAFIVTDEDRHFESVVRDLPEHVEPVRLYESYMRNFEIESGRGAR